MVNYSFVTVWQIQAPLAAVWEAIYSPERWTAWWKGLAQVAKLRSGDALGRGSVYRLVWKSKLPCTLTVEMKTVRVEPLQSLESLAQGELEGKGIWTFSPEKGGTRVQYDWKVRTTKRWMNFLAPFARPIFEWNHDILMRWGEEGLKRFLEDHREPWQSG